MRSVRSYNKIRLHFVDLADPERNTEVLIRKILMKFGDNIKEATLAHIECKNSNQWVNLLSLMPNLTSLSVSDLKVSEGTAGPRDLNLEFLRTVHLSTTSYFFDFPDCLIAFRTIFCRV